MKSGPRRRKVYKDIQHSYDLGLDDIPNRDLQGVITMPRGRIREDNLNEWLITSLWFRAKEFGGNPIQTFLAFSIMIEISHTIAKNIADALIYGIKHDG